MMLQQAPTVMKLYIYICTLIRNSEENMQTELLDLSATLATKTQSQ